MNEMAKDMTVAVIIGAGLCMLFYFTYNKTFMVRTVLDKIIFNIGSIFPILVAPSIVFLKYKGEVNNNANSGK